MHLLKAPQSRLSAGLPAARCLVVFCLGTLVGMGAVQAAEPATAASQAGQISFDIPSQPVAQALFAFTISTGISVLVEDRLTSGRRSTAVKGTFGPEEALNILLTGTGLAVKYTAASAFTLVAAQATADNIAQARFPNAGRGLGREGYFLAVQKAVKRALCSHSRTLPGHYRVVLRLWIDPSGSVPSVELLGSTGDQGRDTQLSAMLTGLSIGAPPADLPQPVTLVVLPRAPAATGDCAEIGAFEKAGN
jgi:hypothetical protein